MKRRLLIFANLLCLVSLSAHLFAQQNLAVSVEAQIAVSDPDQAAHSISLWAEQHDGYFVVRSLDRISFRVPPKALPELRAALDKMAYQVLTYNPAAQDVSNELSKVAAGITSRTDAADRIMKYLSTADVSGTLAFEKELTGLVEEIESLEGRKRYLLDSVALARVEVGLSSAERDIPEVLPSSFAWINNLGLYRFLNATGRGGR
ncbi:MAG TPA: DUF4349 domain-containing protein [Spirochaetia bacterium]|nr:DUF4349 domain-containing protein [Spirochaetia bacterium]